MASKVQENRTGLVEWMRDCGIPPELSVPRIALLVAAVREETKAKCEAAVLRPTNRYTFFGNKMSGHDAGEYLRAKETVEAIRNAD